MALLFLQGLLANFSDGEKLLSALHETSAKALATAHSDDKRDAIRLQVQDMRFEMDNAEKRLNDATNKIGKILFHFKELVAGCEKIDTLLETCEQSLKLDTYPGPDVAEIKTQQDILKVRSSSFFLYFN